MGEFLEMVLTTYESEWTQYYSGPDRATCGDYDRIVRVMGHIQ